ncbi:hypothetical protein VNO78_10330 [Psophocarpus tetragonolobus]|uniref:Membrane-associated kinase regulator 2 n=1 Tax=Psophocarpus tetragonolobus TaxID=3891 RepID=A0AAN9SQX6_PSOTE
MEAIKYCKNPTLTHPSAHFLTDPDEGPFFDLEFALADPNQNQNASESDSDSVFKLTVSPSTSSSSNQPSLSPSEDAKPQFTASLLKSATKLRVFILGLKKPKPNASHNHNKTKLFAVKLKVEEVPIVSFFRRGKGSQWQKQSAEIVSCGSEDKEKRLVRKYLKMVKPLYVRVSRRYTDVSSPESAQASNSEPANQKEKSPLPPPLRKPLHNPTSPPPSSQRSHDSLLQQHDWIQGAILHCKMSFNASTSTATGSANSEYEPREAGWVGSWVSNSRRGDGKCGQRSGKDGDMSSESEIFFRVKGRKGVFD